MQRLDEILKLVSEFEKIDVNSLSEKLQVSKVTIRKDLDKLESKGLLHREHGYAVLNSGDDINVRLSFQYDTKKRIAREAAKLIKDNDTVLIESGSTCALLAEEICQTKKNVKIVTNSYFIADYIQEYVVLTDSSKFEKCGTVRRFALSQVSRVITDKNISQEAKEKLEDSQTILNLV